MKSGPDRTISLIGKEKIIAIIHSDLDHALILRAIEKLKEAGIKIFEITMRVPGAVELVKNLTPYRDIIVGAGTVLDKDSAEKMVKEGVSFIVSPIIVEDVMMVCQKNGVAWIPGALTPAEIYRAHLLGAAAVKVFPAKFFGPEYISAIKKPLGDIKLIPTGGIDSRLAGEFIRAGAHAVGAGSDLFDKEAVRLENWTVIRKRAEEYIRSVSL